MLHGASLRKGSNQSLCYCSAMGGTVLFQDALAQRLGIMRPSRQQLQAFLAAHPPRISPGGGICIFGTMARLQRTCMPVERTPALRNSWWVDARAWVGLQQTRMEAVPAQASRSW
jgi:hypothetical protein